jgi:uncharacterized membrane protein
MPPDSVQMPLTCALVLQRSARLEREPPGPAGGLPWPDNRGLTLTAPGCHNWGMGKQVETAEHREMVARLKEVRAAAIEAARRAAELARERRQIMEALLADGFSQADLARELGVTRQAIQKMIAAGAERRGK